MQPLLSQFKLRLAAQEKLYNSFKEHLAKFDNDLFSGQPTVDDFPKDEKYEWMNVSEPLSLEGNLKNKLVIVDFWTCCCIDCLHVLEEMNYLEKKFEDYPEVVFLGCHSAKFVNERDPYMLK